MSKALWACSLCREDFTRRSSAERHRKEDLSSLGSLNIYGAYALAQLSDTTFF